jgi:nitrogen-specific signal transduction histidine kinase
LLNSFIEFDIIYAPFEYAELHWRLQRLLEINGLREENEVNVQTLGNYERQLARLNDFLAYSLPAFAPYASDADEQIFKHIGMFLRQLSDGLGAENTVLLRFSAEQKELILEATRVEPEADKHKCVFQFDDPFLAPTAQNFEISHWSSAADATPTESATFLEELSAALSRDIHSLILVPILLEQRLYGIIAVINKVTATTFAPLDISFAQISVNFFAKELQRAQLFRSASKDGRVDDLASPFITHINNKLEFLHSILDSVMFGVIVLNHYNQIIYMNNAAERILERRFADLKDENFADIFGPDVLSENFFNHERDTRDVLRYEVELTMADGEPKLIGFASQVHKNFMNQPVGKVVTLRDISSFMLREKEMLRMDRLASLGVLISGIAHEIRNPLAGIKSVAQALDAFLSEKGFENSEYVDRIIRQVNRLNTLLQALFIYSRPDRPQTEKVDIRRVLEEVKPLLQKRLSDKKILYQEYLDANSKMIPADSNQLQQLLLNLILNAIEAMAEQGVLSISIEYLKPIPASMYNQMPYLQRRLLNEAMRIVVADTGVGITPEQQKEIFTPFFTTKDTGTGLGLPIVQQIVENHRGFVHVESKPGQGTRFIVLLPLVRNIDA